MYVFDLSGMVLYEERTASGSWLTEADGPYQSPRLDVSVPSSVLTEQC